MFVNTESSVVKLDVVVTILTVSAILHAVRSSKPTEGILLCLSGFLLGLFVEQASLRFGGTHCHAEGLLNFSKCSSFNSVIYYLPWVYVSISSAKILCGKGVSILSFASVAGLLFSGLCAPYELQGPSEGWWLWPRADGIVKEECDIWQYGLAGQDQRGLVTTAHGYIYLVTTCI